MLVLDVDADPEPEPEADGCGVLVLSILRGTDWRMKCMTVQAEF